MVRSVEQLFVRLRTAGHVGALVEVFEMTAPQLLKAGMHVARDPAAAEHLLQAVFVVVAAGSYRLRVEGEDFVRHEQQLEIDGRDREGWIELVAARRQAFAFQLPDSLDFPHRLHLRLHDERGNIVREESLVGDPALPSLITRCDGAFLEAGIAFMLAF